MTPEFRSLERYKRPRAVDVLFPVVLRLPPLPARVLQLPPQSRLRRELVIRAIVWGYRRVNATGQIPTPLLTRDVVLNQTAAILGTTGTFRGRDGVRDIMSELADTFDDIRFEPESVLEVGDRLVLAVRFSGVGTASGITLESMVGHVYQLDLRAGAGSRLDVYWKVSEALEAVGLAGRAAGLPQP